MKKKILSTILIFTMMLSSMAMFVFPEGFLADLFVFEAAAESYTPEGTGISSLSEIKSGTAGNPNKYYLTQDITINTYTQPTD